MTELLNPNAVPGSNSGDTGTKDAPDYAKIESERLRSEYALIFETALKLRARAQAIPAEIVDDKMKEEVVDLIKLIRDCKTRLEGFHRLEKDPHFRRGQGVDQTFFGEIDLLMKRDKKNNDGEGDTLNNKLTTYDVRKEAEERERREAEARRLAEEQRIAREAREKAEREEQERLEAAERARKPERVEEHLTAAADAGQKAAEARVEEKVASVAAEKAYVNTLAPAANLSRTRTAAGSLSTMQEEKFAEIIDRTKLDKEALWPYIALDALQTALNKVAAANSYSNDASVQIAGARFGKRPKSRVK